METVWRKAFDIETGLEYKIEMPAPAVVRQAILELPFPPAGMTIKNAVKILAENFGLSEEQKNAVTRPGNNIFYHIVALAFQVLKREGKLKQPGGAGKPYFTDLSRVLAKINEIAIASAEGDYIYRGEQEGYDKVSSSLYREYPHWEGTQFDIVSAQNAILAEAKAYIGQTDFFARAKNLEILTELQHFGGKTNLIDFTEDYLMALFFACDGSHDKDGRVILLKRESETEDYKVKYPPRTISRVESQRSVFVESPTGIVKPDNKIPIPADLKMPMLDYLRKHHRISRKTIYNDIHGFIRRSVYGEFLKGLTWLRKADTAKSFEEKLEYCQNAIKHYTEALKLNPKDTNVYHNRALAKQKMGDFDGAIQDYTEALKLNPEDANVFYNRALAKQKMGDFDGAIQDYTEALKLNPEDAEAYANRGEAWLHLQEWEKAKADFITAKNMEVDIVDSFHNDYKSVANFEAKHDVKVPEDIAALLSQH